MQVLIATTSSADDRKTLAAIRSLGRAGARVTVGADRPRAVFYSRHCRRGILYPRPQDDPDGFVDALLQETRRRRIDVLLPLSDHTTFPLVRHRRRFAPHVHLPVPAPEALARAHDKLAASQLAERLGIGVPRTWCPATRAEAIDVAEKVSYPCVFKLRRGAGGVGLRLPRSRDELLRCYDSLSGDVDAVCDRRTPLIQELIPGEVHDVCLLFNEGRVRAALTQRRLRMRPRTGGIGVFNETTWNPALRDAAVRLLEALAWHGPAMVEFKIDARDGMPRLLDVNSRYWGTLDLAIQAGIDFPALACRMALDGDVAPVFEYEVGLRYRWPFPHGLAHAWDAARGGGWRAAVEASWDLFRWDPRCRSDLWPSDPGPHLASLLLALSPASWWR